MEKLLIFLPCYFHPYMNTQHKQFLHLFQHPWLIKQLKSVVLPHNSVIPKVNMISNQSELEFFKSIHQLWHQIFLFFSWDSSSFFWTFFYFAIDSKFISFYEEDFPQIPCITQSQLPLAAAAAVIAAVPCTLHYLSLTYILSKP